MNSREFREATWRERAEDWFFGGLAVAVMLACLTVCVGGIYGPRNLPWEVIGISVFCVVMLIVLAIIVAGRSVVNWLAFLAGIALVVVAAFAKADELPTYSVRYRAALEAAATARFGIEAPVARIAAQIHAESGWNPKAHSIYAQGLAQFTPATARWLPDICADVGEPDPWDPQWSLRAVACYDHYLYTNAPAYNECNRWAFALSDYNGGTGWRQREQRLAAAHGKNPAQWFTGVESYSARAPGAYAENRGYVRKILLRLEPAYIDAGWPGLDVCL